MNTSIKSLFGHALLVTLASAFCYGAVTQAADPCDRSAKTIKLKIKEKNNKPIKVTKGLFGKNADTINACRGDTIEWKLSGKKFFVEFPTESPIDKKKENSNNGKLRITIGAEAKAGARYKYDVGIDGGGILDPIIIIDNQRN